MPTSFCWLTVFPPLGIRKTLHEIRACCRGMMRISSGWPDWQTNQTIRLDDLHRIVIRLASHPAIRVRRFSSQAVRLTAKSRRVQHATGTSRGNMFGGTQIKGCASLRVKACAYVVRSRRSPEPKRAGAVTLYAFERTRRSV